MTAVRDQSDDTRELRRALRDLIGLLALPSLCRGRSRSEVLEALVDALDALIPHTSAYARAHHGERAAEIVRTRDASNAAVDLHALRAAAEMARTSIDVVSTHVAGSPAIAVPLGFYSDAGAIVLVGARVGGERDRMVLRTISALGASALENAQLLESLNDANRRKDEFLAVLGHELRNPLAPVLTAVTLMQRRDPGPDRLRDIIERQARHMTRLVDDLLDISRITRGNVVLQRAHIDLRDVIQHATELASPLIVSREHVLQMQVPSGLVVDGDHVRLCQVFANLLINAARYTDPGGTIVVTAVVVDERVRITVRDSGRGIAPELQERIFEPFVQVNRNKDMVSGGLGLGLAIVRTLVELHGGAVRVFSEGPGTGSEFTVELHLVTTVREDDFARARAATSAGQKTILIVDDSDDNATLLQEVLEMSGHVVITAGDGPGALAQAQRHRPDVVLLDLGLPGADGVEVGKELRARFGASFRLIAVTGYSHEASRARTKNAGFDLHLIKPVDLTRLLEAVEEPRSEDVDAHVS